MLRVAGRPLALTLVMAPSPWAEQQPMMHQQ
jgi:hypothetical protein